MNKARVSPQVRNTPAWLLPNLLSIDAPLIAVLWQALLAQYAGLPLRVPARLALGLTVWAIYVADRLLDVRRRSNVCDTERHRFYLRHSHRAVWLLGIIVAADLLVTFFWLRPAVLLSGLVPLAGVGLYLRILHASERVRPPKELVVALLFTIGTFIVAWSGAPHPYATLFGPAIAFFALCLANLAAIETWESRELASRKAREAHVAIRALGRCYVPSVTCLALACLAHWKASWYASVGLSAAGMVGIYLTRSRIPLELRRTLADLALLSPAFFLR